MISSRQNGRPTTRKVFHVLIAAIYIPGIVLAQNSCTSDENCQLNEFCNLAEGNCNSCIDCPKYNRNGTDNECPKNVSQDCGGCLPGFKSSLENRMDTDTIIGDEVCEAIDLADVQSTISKSKASLTTTTTTRTVTDAYIQTTDQTVKVAGVQSHVNVDSQSYSTTSMKAVTPTVSGLSDVQPTHQTAEEYDEFDAKRPWIYVGIAATFFVLCGTCGVVGFKVFILPRQLKRKAELRKIRAIERTEINTRKTKEDAANASKEEIERLYPDQGQDFTPLILRGYLNKNVRETSH